MSYQRLSGPPVLVDRRSYGNLPPRAMGGILDTLIKVVKGGSDVYQATKGSGGAAAPAEAAPQYAPPAPKSTLQTYLPVIAIGGLAVVGVVLLTRRKK